MSMQWGYGTIKPILLTEPDPRPEGRGQVTPSAIWLWSVCLLGGCSSRGSKSSWRKSCCICWWWDTTWHWCSKGSGSWRSCCIHRQTSFMGSGISGRLLKHSSGWDNEYLKAAFLWRICNPWYFFWPAAPCFDLLILDGVLPRYRVFMIILWPGACFKLALLSWNRKKNRPVIKAKTF